MTDLFLTSKELADLTGYKIATKQAAWLRDRRWEFSINGLGKVMVLRKYCEMRLGVTTAHETKSTAEPDYSRI